MAERRMLSKAVISMDKFVLMPPTAQILYFHVVMNADDDGFTDRIVSIQRTIGAEKTDIDLLVEAGFIFVFDTGVAVDLFWNVNNNIRKDRYKKTVYQEEMQQLSMAEDGRYVLQLSVNNAGAECQPVDNQMTTKPQPVDNQTTAQDRLGKDRLGKENHPSNIQTTSSNSIGPAVDKSVDNSASDKPGNAEQDFEKPRSPSLDGWNSEKPPEGDEYALSPPDAFKAFRAAYPRKQGALRDVQSAWVNATEVGHVLPGDLVYAARKYARTCREEDINPQYIKMPQNFISSGLWRQYIPKYLPSCPHCHGQGVYEDGDRMTLCDCDGRYNEHP